MRPFTSGIGIAPVNTSGAGLFAVLLCPKNLGLNAVIRTVRRSNGRSLCTRLSQRAAGIMSHAESDCTSPALTNLGIPFPRNIIGVEYGPSSGRQKWDHDKVDLCVFMKAIMHMNSSACGMRQPSYSLDGDITCTAFDPITRFFVQVRLILRKRRRPPRARRFIL